MDYQGKGRPSSLFKSFTYAFTGIITVIKAERNMQIHIIAAVIIICFSLYFHLSRMEWLFVLFAIGGMVSLELVNTAIERVVDLVTSERHPLAKQAKDAAAGAVLIYAILSVVAGLIIFIPHLTR